MEAAGLAIGVVGLAGLFNSCLESLAKVQSYRSSQADSHALNTRFRAARTRFEQWGVSVGISQGKLMQDHHPALDNQDTSGVVEDILLIITKAVSEGVNTKGNKAIGSLHQNSPYAADLSQSRRKRLRWALGGKEERSEQVHMLEKLVQELYNLVPPRIEDNHADWLQAKTGLEDLRQMLAMIKHEMEAEVRRNVFVWLGKSPPSDRYDDSISKRVDNTCDWIFERPAFKCWLMDGDPSKPSVLWINGPAGFGKTILCAHIVKHLSKTLATPVAYFFFTSDHESRENPYWALRSWISQVAVCHDGAFGCVREAWEVDPSEHASRRVLTKLFKTLLDTVPGCTFVVDGFDECAHLENGDTSVAKFLSDIVNTASGSDAKLLFISRDEPEIRNAIMDNTTYDFAEYRIELEDVRPDTAAFSQSIVDRKLSGKNEDTRAAISESMTERCQGQFLWLKMQEDLLRSGMSKKRLQEAVENTPSGLDRLYDRNWAKITNMPRWERDRVTSLLRWAAFAFRPLTIYEITEAVLITQFEELDPEELPDKLDDDYVRTEVVGLCGPLLEVKQPPDTSSAGHRTVHIPHFSVRQYLLHQLPIPSWIQPNGRLQEPYERIQHTVLARACLQYISLPQVWTDEMDQRAHDETLRFYAAERWFSHVESGFQDSSILEISEALLSDENPVYNFLAKYVAARFIAKNPNMKRPLTPLEYALWLDWEVMAKSLLTDKNVNETDWKGRTPISLACVAGMTDVVSKALHVGADLMIVDRFGQTPLYLAAWNGSEEIIKTLVERGADLAAQNEDGDTPLHSASSKGHVRACEYLIHSGSRLTTKSNRGYTPLHLACGSGHSEVVRLILQNGPKTMVNDTHASGAHPLHFASANGDIETAKALLEYGARSSIFVSENDGWSPLAIASSHGHIAMVKLLLDHGAEATLKTANNNSSTPLHAAAISEGNNIELVELLVCRGAQATITTPDVNGETPLHLASRKGRTEIVKYLLDHGAERTIEVQDLCGDTPLYSAAANGHVEVVKVLLEHGAEATITVANSYHWTPLFAASSNDSGEIIKCLLNYGGEATIATPDRCGETPLHIAANMGHFEVAKRLLVTSPAHCNIRDRCGRTPLFCASRFGNHEVVDLLLSTYCIDPDPTDWMGSSPLFAAVANGHLEAVKLLISRGATINPWAPIGQSFLWWARRTGNLELVQFLEHQETSIDVPNRGAYTSYEPPADDAIPAVFDSSLWWCDVCTLCVESGQGYQCIECTYSSLVVCFECFDRGFQLCTESHMLVPR